MYVVLQVVMAASKSTIVDDTIVIMRVRYSMCVC